MRTGIAPQRAGLFGRGGRMVRINSMARGARR
jgi:hypothetical protein